MAEISQSALINLQLGISIHFTALTTHYDCLFAPFVKDSFLPHFFCYENVCLPMAPSIMDGLSWVFLWHSLQTQQTIHINNVDLHRFAYHRKHIEIEIRSRNVCVQTMLRNLYTDFVDAIIYFDSNGYTKTRQLLIAQGEIKNMQQS